MISVKNGVVAMKGNATDVLNDLSCIIEWLTTANVSEREIRTAVNVGFTSGNARLNEQEEVPLANPGIEIKVATPSGPVMSDENLLKVFVDIAKEYETHPGAAVTRLGILSGMINK